MSPSRRHDAVLVLLAIVLAALAIAGAPLVYDRLVAWRWIDPGATGGGDPFGKVLRRVLMIPPAACVILGMRPWRDLTLADMGLRGPRSRPFAGLLAFVVSLLVVGAMLGFQAAMGWLRFEVTEPAGQVAGRLAVAGASALVVALLENWFFRAWLPLLTARWFGTRLAEPTALLVFAGAHAFRANRLDVQVTHDTAGAWEAVKTWLATLFDYGHFGTALLGLALFGVLLTLAYRRTGSLWVPIGIHAAGVLTILGYGAFTERLDTPAWAGTKVLYDGVPGWAVLLGGVLVFARRRGPSADDVEPRASAAPTA